MEKSREPVKQETKISEGDRRRRLNLTGGLGRLGNRVDEEQKMCASAQMLEGKHACAKKARMDTCDAHAHVCVSR